MWGKEKEGHTHRSKKERKREGEQEKNTYKKNLNGKLVHKIFLIFLDFSSSSSLSVVGIAVILVGIKLYQTAINGLLDHWPTPLTDWL